MTVLDMHAPRRLRRSLVGGALAFTAAALTLLAVADRPAAALGLPPVPVVDAACAGLGTLTFTPGLTLTARPTEFSGTGVFFPCASTKVVRGTFGGAGSGTLSCTGGTAEGTLFFDWLTTSGGSASSRVEYRVGLAVGPDGTRVVFEGTVTDGLFKGDRYRSSVQASGVDPQNCLSANGVTSAIGAGAAVFERGPILEHGLLGL